MSCDDIGVSMAPFVRWPERCEGDTACRRCMLTIPSKPHTSSSHVAGGTGVRRTTFLFGILLPIASHTARCKASSTGLVCSIRIMGLCFASATRRLQDYIEERGPRRVLKRPLGAWGHTTERGCPWWETPLKCQAALRATRVSEVETMMRKDEWHGAASSPCERASWPRGYACQRPRG